MTDKGRTSLVFVDPTGPLQVEAGPEFDKLNVGYTDNFTLSYVSVDAYGSQDGADVSVTITGMNDAPVVSAPLDTTVSEEDPIFEIDLLQGALDVYSDVVLSAINLVKASGQGG